MCFLFSSLSNLVSTLSLKLSSAEEKPGSSGSSLEHEEVLAVRGGSDKMDVGRSSGLVMGGDWFDSKLFVGLFS